MRPITIAASLAALFAVTVLAGCYGDVRVRDDRYEARRVYGPPPQPVYVQPAPQPVYVPAPQPIYQPAPIVVQEAPPPVQFERPGPPPGAGFVWVGGYWDREGPRWVWRPGHYDRPPRAGARYESPHWDRTNAGFELRIGGWH